MEYEWDQDKRLANLDRHGIDFVRAKEIWQGPVVEVPSPQIHHGENRFLAIGTCEGRLITIVFTMRDNRRRIISARAARKNEKENYRQKIG